MEKMVIAAEYNYPLFDRSSFFLCHMTVSLQKNEHSAKHSYITKQFQHGLYFNNITQFNPFHWIWVAQPSICNSIYSYVAVKLAHPSIQNVRYR